MAAIDINSLRVLIVEDNVHFRTLIRTILEALGVGKMEEATDGASAIEVLNRFDADLAIMDWKMDGVDGLQCLKRVRSDADSPNRFLPVLMVTGFADEELAREARNAGVNDFLSKPISAKSLLSRIVAVLESERPFIEAGGYFGPDRRYQEQPFDGPDRRKSQSGLVTPGGPSDG